MSGCLPHKAQQSTPSALLSLITIFRMPSAHRCAIRSLVASVKKSPSRTLGGRARSAAGSPSRLGRTAAGLAVAESSALFTNTPLAIAGGTGMWDGDAEDPALRSVLLMSGVKKCGLGGSYELSPFSTHWCRRGMVVAEKKRGCSQQLFSREAHMVGSVYARVVQATVEVSDIVLGKGPQPPPCSVAPGRVVVWMLEA